MHLHCLRHGLCHGSSPWRSLSTLHPEGLARMHAWPSREIGPKVGKPRPVYPLRPPFMETRSTYPSAVLQEDPSPTLSLSHPSTSPTPAHRFHYTNPSPDQQYSTSQLHPQYSNPHPSTTTFHPSSHLTGSPKSECYNSGPPAGKLYTWKRSCPGSS